MLVQVLGYVLLIDIKWFKTTVIDTWTLPLGEGALPGYYCSDSCSQDLSTMAGSGDVSSIFIYVKGSYRQNRTVNISSVSHVKNRWIKNCIWNFWVGFFLFFCCFYTAAWRFLSRCAFSLCRLTVFAEGHFADSPSVFWNKVLVQGTKTGIWLLSF